MRSRGDMHVVMEIVTTDRLQLTVAGKRIDIASRKARAALGYMVLNDSHTERREHLVGLLWSETDEEKARGSLRHCIKEIRLAIRGTAFAGLQLDTQDIGFDKNLINVDIWEICELAKRGEVHPMLLDRPLLTDDLLKDVETVDPVFQTWLLTKRQSFNQRLIRHLEDALQTTPVAERRGEDIARAILNLDPTHEEACRQLMRARAHHGDIGGALKIYTALWELLDTDYDVEPTEQTQTLFAELKAALPLAGAPAAIEAAPQATVPIMLTSVPPRRVGATKLVLSIAPFDVAGIAPERRYLVQGFRGELIAYLARFREWVVREQPPGGVRTSEQSDEYLLQAQPMPVKDGARLVLSLRECATDAYLWGDGLDLKTVDWSETQQAIVRRIAAALNIHVSIGRLAQVGPRQSADLLAFDLWLRGQNQIMPFEPPGWVEATKLYRSIIREHPNFAPAYSSLAQLQNGSIFVHPGTFRSPESTAEALRCATQAVYLDPMDSRSQLSLGWSYAMAGKHDQSAIHHALAVELNPSDSWTLASAGLGFAFRGDFSQATHLTDLAATLSTSITGAQWRYQAMVYYLSGDYAASIAAAANAEHSIQNVLVWKAASQSQLGLIGEAKSSVERFFGLIGEKWCNNEVAPTRTNIARWFLHAFPIRNPSEWTRLRDDFCRAGAPVDGLVFDQW